jgi:hypothetical protein
MKPSSAAVATATLRERRLGRAKKYEREDCEKNYGKGFLHFSLSDRATRAACGSELRGGQILFGTPTTSPFYTRSERESSCFVAGSGGGKFKVEGFQRLKVERKGESLTAFGMTMRASRLDTTPSDERRVKRVKDSEFIPRGRGYGGHGEERTKARCRVKARRVHNQRKRKAGPSPRSA